MHIKDTKIDCNCTPPFSSSIAIRHRTSSSSSSSQNTKVNTYLRAKEFTQLSGHNTYDLNNEHIYVSLKEFILILRRGTNLYYYM